MRFVVLLVALSLAGAQQGDPAYEPLERAYEALRAKDYERAIESFRKAVELAPERAPVRKDLGYAYLKVGENARAMEQFRETMRLDPADTQVALEYAFLCNEANRKAEARRIFDGIRKTGNATAEQAFQNIDRPLAEGIERWKKAIGMGANDFSAHFELASLAEQRDELELAAEHYEKAWRALPDRRYVLVDLGRVWKALGRTDDATAALVAASRGGEARAAELARELLPDRYPYVYEFQSALKLDPANIGMRRELAYLLLRMNRQADAETEFQQIVDKAPDDLLSVTQLGFLLNAKGDRAAQPLFDRVLAGKDVELANRVRAVLHMPQVSQNTSSKEMAERSLKAGYLKDALRYLRAANEADPADFEVMLKLGWTNNMLHDDAQAVYWFDMARKSPDAEVAKEAEQGWRGLHASLQRVRTTGWVYPMFSTRWHDLFSYAQIKTEVRLKGKVRAYASMRFVGDTRKTIGAVIPQYLSESSVIPGVGMAAGPWHGALAWAEAGLAYNYLTHHMMPDYRGGVSLTRGIGHTLRGESPGRFAEAAVDGVFMSRFGNEVLSYNQLRAGYTAGPRVFRVQVGGEGNVVFDSQRQEWANFSEVGAGLRISGAGLPKSMYFTVDAMRGWYLVKEGRFNDVRAGVWYAFTR